MTPWVRIDQVVGRIGEEGVAFVGTGPLSSRVGRRDELRRHWRGSPESRIIKNSQIFLHGAPSVFFGFPFGSRYRTLLVGIGCNQAGIDRKSFRAHQSLRKAALHHYLEHMSQDIALPEPAMAVLGEAGMIRNLAVQPEAAEPAIGEVEVDLFTQSPLGADTHGIADDEHPHHQFGINRRATCGAIERLQLRSNAVQFEMAVNPAQHVVDGDVIV